MTITDVFSKRGKPLPDVYVYELPTKLRRQLANILRHDVRVRLLGPDWKKMAQVLAREHGHILLPTDQMTGTSGEHFGGHDYALDCEKLLLEAETPEALDVIEISLRSYAARPKTSHRYDDSVSSRDVINEVNHRFRENGCGYQYVDSHIVRIDSDLTHAEVVKPALALLRQPGFEGPNEEYLSAHEHYRHGRIKEAIQDASKAFESTMKAICAARGWTPDKNATAKPLIQLLISNGLVPSYSEEQLQHVVKCLMGVATVRNKESGHGDGAKPREVPEHYAAYALHLAASNIVFLVECHKAMA